MQPFLCAQAHLCIIFSKSWRGFGRFRFGSITTFVGFGPQTTLGGIWAATNAASTLKISGPWAKLHRRQFDFREVYLLVCNVTLGRVFTNPHTAQRHLNSVKIAAIHSNRTILTLTLNPKLKTTPTLTLTLNLRWAARGFVIMPLGHGHTGPLSCVAAKRYQIYP